LDGRVAEYWRDPDRAVSELIEALQEYYPVESSQDSPRSDRIERRYRELALRTYDIVDLANLPVVDRNLATRELLLRSLYVSLRVAVETSTDSTGLEDTLSRVEARRRQPSSMELASDIASNFERWSVGERLGLSRRLVILGDPGAGKSTLLRWIATAYLLRLNADPDWRELPDVTTLPNEDWLPILVRCRDLDESYISGPLEDILSRHLKKFGIASSEAEGLNKLLLDRLSHGRALLLLDGLDEIVSPIVRARFCRQIEQVCVAYPDTPIIATSRIVGYREIGLRIGRGFEHSTVLDLTAEDKDEFVHRWCMVTEPVIRREPAEEELKSDIHSTDRIERLTGNPMLLTTMALVKKKVGKLPSKRADLYREAVEVLLNWRSEVDELLDPYEAMPQLEYIAYTMCLQGVQQLRADEMIALLWTMRKEYPSVRAVRRHEPLEFLQLLERRTGILIEAGSVRFKGQLVPIYEFRHLTFQEYLAGLSLVAGRFPDRNRERSLADNVAPLAAQTVSTEADNESEPAELTVTENWREALRLCVMSCNDDDVDSVLLAIAKPRESEEAALSSRPRAVLALSCLSDEPNVSEDVAGELVDRFVNVLQENDGSGPSRTVADRALYEVGKSLWAPFVAKRIVKEWRSRRVEARWLGGSAATVLGKSAPADHEALRIWLMGQLRSLSSVISIDRICGALAIMDVIYSRRRTRSPSDADQAMPLVSSIAPKLIEMLKQSKREVEAGAWALGWLGADPSEGEGLWVPSGRQTAALISLIKNPKTSPMAAGFLLWPLRGDHSSNTRFAQAVADRIANSYKYGDSINALAQEYGRLFSSYRDPIFPLLNHASGRVRSLVAAVLGDIGDAGAVEPLVRLLTDADGNVVDSVVRALGDIGDAGAVEPLVRLLTDGNVVYPVAEALGRIGDPGAVEPLVRLLTDSDGNVVYPVAAALGRIGDPGAVEPLVRLLTDADGNVVDSVVRALGDIGDAGAVEPLVRLLTDADGNVVYPVAEALGRIGDPDTVEPLVKSARARKLHAPSPAVAALATLGVDWALLEFQNLLKGQPGEKRRAALWAMALTEREEYDRVLLSRDVDGLSPGIDPAQSIKLEGLKHYAKETGLTVEEVCGRYKLLQSKYGLQLTW
jgi:HEAT repeat protein